VSFKARNSETSHRYQRFDCCSDERFCSSCSGEEILGKMEEAENIMGKIDAGDVPFIALALSFPNDGIWTEDKHFLRQRRVKIWLTRDLLKLIRE